MTRLTINTIFIFSLLFTFIFSKNLKIKQTTLNSWQLVTFCCASQITIDENDYVWIIMQNQIYFRGGITSSNLVGSFNGWKQLSGTWKSVSVHNGVVWAIDQNYYVQSLAGYSPSTPTGTGWNLIDNPSTIKLFQIVLGMDGLSAWGVGNNGNLYYRSVSNGVPTSSWASVLNGPVPTVMSAGTNGVWVVDKMWNVYYSAGNLGVKSTFTELSAPGIAAIAISCGADGTVWMVDTKNNLRQRTGITSTTPQGTAWVIVPITGVSRASNIARGTNSIWGYDVYSNIFMTSG